MERIAIEPRQNWSREVEALGFDFYNIEGIPYWNESAYYKFSLAEIEEIEAATNTLHGLCLRAVDKIVGQKLFPLLGINPWAAELITESWKRQDPAVYGRFDLIYDGVSPPKMLEYNADTPTSLFESAVVQWNWKEQRHPKADQFNSIHEALIERWASFRVGRRNMDKLYVTCATPMPEDEATTQYMGHLAAEAGFRVKFLPIQEIGWDGSSFVDLDNNIMGLVFKLYPWEWLIKDSFGVNVKNAKTSWLEPAWKMLLSNKGILPVLWDMFPEHPNLLAAYRDDSRFDKDDLIVRKPVLGREGANVTIYRKDRAPVVSTDGRYSDGGFVYQQFAQPFQTDEFKANIGAWMVADKCHGMGIREASTLVIDNRSSFVPHIFEG